MRVLGASLIAAGALAAGCLVSSTAPDGLERDVTLAPGQATTIADGALRLEFHGVSADTRCPTDVNCVHAGDAVVHISVTTGQDTEPLDLHTASPAPVRHDDFLIQLLRLQPERHSSHDIQPGEYRATMRVTR
jgi:hypothetical protein